MSTYLLQTLKENIQQEYREVVERRVFTGDIILFFSDISTFLQLYFLTYSYFMCLQWLEQGLMKRYLFIFYLFVIKSCLISFFSLHIINNSN